MAYQYSNTPLYVRDGDYIQFRYTAPPFWDFTETITVKIGDLFQFWLITTVPEDFEPDPFPFNPVRDAELDTLYTYADGSRVGESIITVTGLTPTTQASIAITANIVGGIDTYSLRIDYNGDGTWDTDWIQDTVGLVVENGAKIQVRAKTQGFANKQTRVTVTIGIGFEIWTITTRDIPKNIPDPFPVFDDLNGLPVGTLIYSNVIRIQGLNTPANVSLDNGGQYAVSNSNTTFTNGDGYDELVGATWQSSGATVTNGQYLQLRLLSSANPSTPRSTSLSIGDESNGSAWQITTGAAPSTNPTSFVFPDVTDAVEGALIASDARPLGGIQGLGTTVPVTLVSTTSTEVKIKINNGSIGVFPTSVQNGDLITLYARSSPSFSSTVETQIKVGSRTITPWQVTTSSGPDTDAIFNVPTDRTNVVPLDFVSSSVITVTSVNRPITISATNGALISIDFDTPVVGPRTFDPAVNKNFYLILQASGNLITPTSTTVTVGTGTLNNPFVWSVTTYASVPPPATDLGVWYSRKTEKFDGYPIGTVLPILKEGVSATYGDLGGDLGSRYAGFIECDGRSVSAQQYWALFEVIGNTYGGTGSYNPVTKVYSGNFKLPDYRNRRLAGTGFVDGSRASSSFLPVTNVGGDIFKVGSEGGYWYFDRVDVAGTQPLEQVEGTGVSGIDSQFFSLGTVRITGLETVTTEIPFTVTGFINGQIGPLGEVIVQVPIHNHVYLSGVIETEEGDPLIPWNGRMLFGTNITEAARTYDGLGGATSDNLNSQRATLWERFIREDIGGEFLREIALYDPAYSDFDVFLAQLPRTGVPQPGSDTSTRQETKIISWLTHWPSPASNLNAALASGNLTTISTAVGGGRKVAGVIDTQSNTFTINTSTGDGLPHSHFLTLDPVENPQTDFSGGNVGGAGIIGAPFGSGLGNGATTVQVGFTTGFGGQNDLFMELTEGTFKFSSSFKKPIPDVALAPQRQVPILNPFHKTKYVIKAY
jgi:hypothetical protein